MVLLLIHEPTLVEEEQQHGQHEQRDRAQHVVHERIGRKRYGRHGQWPTHYTLSLVVLDRVGRQFDALARSVVDERDQLGHGGEVLPWCPKSGRSSWLANKQVVDEEDLLYGRYGLGSTHLAIVGTTSRLIGATMEKLGMGKVGKKCFNRKF